MKPIIGRHIEVVHVPRGYQVVVMKDQDSDGPWNMVDSTHGTFPREVDANKRAEALAVELKLEVR